MAATVVKKEVKEEVKPTGVADQKGDLKPEQELEIIEKLKVLTEKAVALEKDNAYLKEQVSGRDTEIDRLVLDHKAEMKGLKEGRASKPKDPRKVESHEAQVKGALLEFYSAEEVEKMAIEMSPNQLSDILDNCYVEKSLKTNPKKQLLHQPNY